MVFLFIEISYLSKILSIVCFSVLNVYELEGKKKPSGKIAERFFDTNFV